MFCFIDSLNNLTPMTTWSRRGAERFSSPTRPCEPRFVEEGLAGERGGGNEGGKRLSASPPHRKGSRRRTQTSRKSFRRSVKLTPACVPGTETHSARDELQRVILVFRSKASPSPYFACCLSCCCFFYFLRVVPRGSQPFPTRLQTLPASVYWRWRSIVAAKNGHCRSVVWDLRGRDLGLSAFAPLNREKGQDERMTKKREREKKGGPVLWMIPVL